VQVLARRVEWSKKMTSVILAILLFIALIAILREDTARERRVVTQRDMPREQLLPHHYHSFVEVENKLWAATAEDARTAKWDTTLLKLRTVELQLVGEYVQGLQRDFKTGNRIFAVVVSRCPEAEIFRRLEWQRIKIELPYHGWRALIRFHLWTGRVSPMELKHLTQVVATLAYEVRRILDAIEQAGHVDVVESLLRDY
jgi:hypothetical protein